MRKKRRGSTFREPQTEMKKRQPVKKTVVSTPDEQMIDLITLWGEK